MGNIAPLQDLLTARGHGIPQVIPTWLKPASLDGPNFSTVRNCPCIALPEVGPEF